MASINGTNVLIYSNGQPIAMQKGLTLGIDIDLIDSSSKDSGGWAEHLTGLVNAKIDLTALFGTGLLSDTPAVLSAKDLMDYIINRDSLLISILGGSFPIVGQADMSSISFEAPMEGAMTLSGSLKVNGMLYALTGAMAQLLTGYSDIASTYDIFTHTATTITSAIKSTAGNKIIVSNDISIVDTYNYKLITYLTLNSGQLPSCKFYNSGGSEISNTETLVEGLNIVTLTAIETDPASTFRFINTAMADWLTTPIYLFKV